MFYCFGVFFVFSFVFVCLFSPFFLSLSAPLSHPFCFVILTPVCMLLDCKPHVIDSLTRVPAKNNTTGTPPPLTWCLEKTRHLVTAVRIVQRWNQSYMWGIGFKRPGADVLMLVQHRRFICRPVVLLCALDRRHSITSLKEPDLRSRLTPWSTVPSCSLNPQKLPTCHLYPSLKTNLRAGGKIDDEMSAQYNFYVTPSSVLFNHWMVWLDV